MPQQHLSSLAAHLDIDDFIQRYPPHSTFLPRCRSSQHRFLYFAWLWRQWLLWWRRLDRLWLTWLDGQWLDAPYQVFLITWDVDEAGVRLSSSAILHEHLTTLHHLNIMILRQWFLRIDSKERRHSAQYPFNILRVSLELVLADPIVDFFDLTFWVFWGTLMALFHELWEGETVFGVDIWVVVECVQENQTVGEQKCLVLIFKVLRIFFSVGSREFFDNSLDLIAFTR